MKYAIRIVNGEQPHITKLFAIVAEKNVTKYRNLANQTINSDSSDWVISEQWSFSRNIHDWSDLDIHDWYL